MLEALHNSGQVFGVENNCGEANVDVPRLDDGEVTLDRAVCLAGSVLSRDPFNEKGLRGQEGVASPGGGEGGEV